MTKTAFFSIASDELNLGYFKMMANSLKKFHPDIPLLLWDSDKVKKYKDDMWLYRATPSILYELKDEYDLIIELNADQIIMGNLDYILKGDYEMGVVYNFNRVDTQRYGVVSCLDIPNQYYYNLGTIAIRSKRLIKNWYNLCYSYHFMNYRYREQDLMNILAYYGDYKLKCFDEYDPKEKYSAWHGLRSRGETTKTIFSKGEVILPKAEDGYPERDKKIKIYHFAGAPGEVRMNYHIYFPEKVNKYIDWLVSDDKRTWKEMDWEKF